jgi:hypothetical protein
MRKLTLDEKISFKGLFERKNITGLNWLDISNAMHFYRICYGYVKRFTGEHRAALDWLNEISTESELLQHCNEDNMLLTIDTTKETIGNIYHSQYYLLTFHVDNKPIYRPIAESNIDRIFAMYDTIKHAMIFGRQN